MDENDFAPWEQERIEAAEEFFKSDVPLAMSSFQMAAHVLWLADHAVPVVPLEEAEAAAQLTEEFREAAYALLRAVGQPVAEGEWRRRVYAAAAHFDAVQFAEYRASVASAGDP